MGCDQARIEHCNCSAITRRIVFHMPDSQKAGSAWQVLHDHCGLPGDVPRQVSRDRPRILIIAATGGITDDDIDGLAAIKIVGERRACRKRKQAKYKSRFVSEIAHCYSN